MIARAGSRKVRNVVASPGARAVVCQVDGPRWLAFEGPATVSEDPARVAELILQVTSDSTRAAAP